MCGISIAIDTTNQAMPHEQITALNDKVFHRGPDDEGFYFGENFAFGHRRLSIIDLSSAGHQPMTRNKLCITYNGEIYNYIELRNQLVELGHTFQSASDTEVILAAYEEWGTSAFSKFNGMWAFAIHDATSNSIIFCRDHFGIKPLYYTKTKKYFLAGSEIKQFTSVNEFEPILNKSVAVNFLVNGLLNHSSETFFEGVNELRPGHYLSYQLTTHETKTFRWYDLDKASVKVRDDYQVAVGKVRSLFVDSVRLRMRSDVRVGSCLSGGIDSSSIVSTIHTQQLANADFATITSCYADATYDEQQFSDLVTKQTGFKSAKVFPALNDLDENGDLDKMVYHQDQPFSGASHYSEFKVFETARKEKMIVMQDGQGSDEYLAGYQEFFSERVSELVTTLQWRAAVLLLRQKAIHRTRSFYAELTSFLRSQYIFPIINNIKSLVGRSNYSWLSDEWKKIAATSLVTYQSRGIRALSLNEMQHSSIPYQLHSEDRNSMLFSIESRLPFLDHRLVEYCIGLPSSYKIRDGYSKAVLRDAMAELPEPIKYRKDKMGFVAPDPTWILQNKDQVRKDLEYIIESTGVFSAELLARFDRFVSGELGYEPIYFRALTFSRFCKQFKMKVNP